MYFISQQCSQYLTNVNYYQFLKYQTLSGLGCNRLGLYSECLEDANNQFYLIEGRIDSIHNANKKMFMSGVCFKSLCSAHDLEYVARSINEYIRFPFTFIGIQTPSQIQQVYNLQTIAVISILSLLVLLFLVSSLLDFIKINKEIKFIQIFSIKTTLKLLESRSEASNQRIKTFSGIKTISLVAIVLTNVLIIAFYAPTTSFERQQNSLIYISFFGVDLWIMTTGFFVSYLLLKQFNKLKSYKILILKIVRRFLRFWPIYAICLCLNWNIIELLGYGPLLPLLRDFPKKHCSTYFSHFVMLSNIFEQKCYNALWLLQLDLQLCSIYIPLLILYIKSQSIICRYSFRLVQLFFFISSVVFSLRDMPSQNKLNSYFFQMQYSHFNILPFVRCGAFMVGYDLGIIYYEFKRHPNRQEFWLIKILSQPKYRLLITALGFVGLAVIAFSFVAINDNPLQDIHFFYFASLRTLIPLAVVAVILPSLLGYGGVVKKVLESWICNFVSKLSCSLLCLHYVISIFIIYNRQFDLELSNFTILNISFCTIIPSVVLSMVLTSVVEIPVFVCKKVYWKTQRITYFEH